MPRVYTIPKGTEEAKCPRGCGMPIFWIETPRSGVIGKVRMPIDTNGPDGSDPDSWSAGTGRNHFEFCVVEGGL